MMQIKEAYEIMELSDDASPEEAKKKYRELTRKYHPDVNKEEGSEDRFKKINEAYYCISNKDNINEQNIFGRSIQMENISLHTTISFKDSVLGCKKEFKFTRNGKCSDCHGNGEVAVNNGCNKCHGRGQIIEKHGNMIISMTCDKCNGRSSSISCQSCSATGIVEMQSSITINIPGGVINGNILRLQGMGNYVGSFMNMDQYTEAYLHLTITEEKSLSIDNMDVVCTIQLSLLEALRGTEKIVNTIFGEKTINIPPLSKNKEEVKLPNLGVNGVGFQRIILHVDYPTNVDNLINLLNLEELS